MWGGDSRRGVSEVLGAILVFAILVSGVAVYQMTVVPQTNEEREFEHSQQVRSSMQDLRSAIVTAGANGGPRSVSVRTGVDYPTRSLTLNPPEPGGTLGTTEALSDGVVLSNLQAVDPEARDFWSDGASAFSFETRHLQYRPSYNYYHSAPTTRYEPTVVYSSFEDTEVVESQQSLVSGRTLNLMLLQGEVGGQGSFESIDVNPISATTRTLRLEPSGNATLELRTGLSKATWTDLLASNPDAEVVSYDDSTTPSTVTIDLADSGVWRLRVGMVSLNRPGATTSPAYVTATTPTAQTITNGESTDLTVRVADRYGAPVEGVTVSFDGTDRTTGPDGLATLEVSPSSDRTVTAAIGGAAEERVEFDVDVTSSSVNLGSQVNPSDGVVVQSVSGSNPVDVTFKNKGSSTATISEVRVNYFFVSTTGNPTPTALSWGFDGNDDAASVGGGFVSQTVTVAPGNTETLTFNFDTSGVSGNPDNEFFITSVVFDDGSSRLYFVTPD
jgi:hypothetical protein